MVMYLGKIWDCGANSRSLGVHINTHNIAVLLIDEADVFLEERTMADIQRNSLVSGTYSKLD